MSKDTPSLSRGLVFQEIGKRTETLKTSVSDKMKKHAEIRAEELGYKDTASWLFDVLIGELYGHDYLISLYRAQYDRAQKLTASGGPVSKNVVDARGGAE